MGKVANKRAKRLGAPATRRTVQSRRAIAELTRQLEAGIFSHEVRSGLTGAADVDGDGRAGFVETANRRIPRDQYRPHVYYRGPGGNRHAALFPSSRLNGKELVLGMRPQRLWMRGPSGERR